MDVKAIAEEMVKKITGDPKVLDSFKKNPIPVVEKLLGVDLPDEQIKKVADLVMAKIDIDKAASLLGGLAGMLKK